MIAKQKTAAVSSEEGAQGSGLTDAISIDFSLIPDRVRDELAATTLDSVRAFLQQPGGREALDAKIAKKKRATVSVAKAKGVKH